MRVLCEGVQGKVALAQQALAEAIETLGSPEGLTRRERAHRLWLLGRLMSGQDLLDVIHEDLRALARSDTLPPSTDEVF
jgi:hypothetical protein